MSFVDLFEYCFAGRVSYQSQVKWSPMAFHWLWRKGMDNQCWPKNRTPKHPLLITSLIIFFLDQRRSPSTEAFLVKTLPTMSKKVPSLFYSQVLLEPKYFLTFSFWLSDQKTRSNNSALSLPLRPASKSEKFLTVGKTLDLSKTTSLLSALPNGERAENFYAATDIVKVRSSCAWLLWSTLPLGD